MGEPTCDDQVEVEEVREINQRETITILFLMNICAFVNGNLLILHELFRR